MANVTAVQTLEDGPRNVVLKMTGLLDGSADISGVTLVDPATLGVLQPGRPGSPKATKLYLTEVDFMIQDALAVDLYWDATTPVLIDSLTGRGGNDYRRFGGLSNNAGAGVNGKITVTSVGATGGAAKQFTIIAYCTKTGAQD